MDNIVIIACSSIVDIVLDRQGEIRKEKRDRIEEKARDYYRNRKKLEIMDLRSQGLTQKYIKGLSDHPELKYFLNIGEKFKTNTNFTRL